MGSIEDDSRIYQFLVGCLSDAFNDKHLLLFVVAVGCGDFNVADVPSSEVVATVGRTGLDLVVAVGQVLVDAGAFIRLSDW